MKDTLIAILVLIVLVLGYFFIKEKNQDDNRNPWPETEPATPTNNNPTSTNNNQTNTNNNPTPEQHEYANSVYDFYVDLDGRVVTQKTAVGMDHQMMYFDKPNGERDFIVSVFTDSQWQRYWNSLSTTYDFVGTVMIDGVTFNYHTKPAIDPGINDPQTLHYYIAEHNGLYYQIYTTNTAHINSFGFLD